jgi:alpha-galactosidase
VNTIKTLFIENEIDILDFDLEIWHHAQTIEIKRYWSGVEAEIERRAIAKIIWTNKSLYIRFDAAQFEPLVVNQNPNLAGKTDKLWENDVCEIFIAPNTNEPERYYEFEIAPTGEWIDLAIHQLPDSRETDSHYHSGMKTSAKIEENSVVMICKINWWQAFGRVPQDGEKWPVNLFRCVGRGENRGFLAWQPTLTEKPNFHVPQVFGWLEFVRTKV